MLNAEIAFAALITTDPALSVHTSTGIGETTVDLGSTTRFIACRGDCVADLAALVVQSAMCPTHGSGLLFRP